MATLLWDLMGSVVRYSYRFQRAAPAAPRPLRVHTLNPVSDPSKGLKVLIRLIERMVC